MQGGKLLFLTLIICDINSVWMVKAEKREKRTVDHGPRCPRGCTRCSVENGCLACNTRLFLFFTRNGMRQQGICTHSCPIGYYGVRGQNYDVCYRCQIRNCDACYSMNHCSRCTPPYISYRGRCIDQCPNGQYYANFSRDCQHAVNCMVGPWSLWSQCMRNGQNCGYKYGMITRTREILEYPSPNGAACPNLVESRCCRMENRHCADIIHNNSDLTIEKRKTLPKKQRRKRRKRKRKKIKRKNRKRKKKGKKKKRKRKNNFRKRINSKRKRKLRLYKKAWRHFCRQDIVYNDINEILIIR